jgi:DNA-binding MarR family transcriptional regulator
MGAPRKSARTKHVPRSIDDLTPGAIIESVLRPSGEPVLGLRLHVAHGRMMRTYSEQVGRGEITPNLIGVLAIVSVHEGISQTELARLLRLERATVGVHVERCIEKGFIRRIDSEHDGRKYALSVTTRGKEMLRRLQSRIPPHETYLAAALTPEERRTLLRLLDKLALGYSTHRIR